MPNIESPDVLSQEVKTPESTMGEAANSASTAAYRIERLGGQLRADITDVGTKIGDNYIAQRTAQETVAAHSLMSQASLAIDAGWKQAVALDGTPGHPHDPNLVANTITQPMQDAHDRIAASLKTVEARKAFEDSWTEYATATTRRALAETDALGFTQAEQSAELTAKTAGYTLSQNGAASLPEQLPLIEGQYRALQAVATTAEAKAGVEKWHTNALELAAFSTLGAEARSAADKAAAATGGDLAAAQAAAQERVDGIVKANPWMQTVGGDRNPYSGETGLDTVIKAQATNATETYHAGHASALQQMEQQRNSALSKWDQGTYLPDGSIDTSPARLQQLNQISDATGELPSTPAEIATRREVYMKAVRDKTNNVAQTDNVPVRNQLAGSLTSIDKSAIDGAFTAGQITEASHKALTDQWTSLHEHPGWNEAFKPIESAAEGYGTAMVQGSGPSVGTNGLGVGGHGDPTGERNKADFHARVWNQFAYLAGKEGPDKAQTEMLDSGNAYFIGRIASTYAGARGRGVQGAGVAVGNARTFGPAHNAVPSPDTAAKFKKFTGAQ